MACLSCMYSTSTARSSSVSTKLYRPSSSSKLTATALPAALSWLVRADKGAGKFALHLGRDSIHIDSLSGEKTASILHAVHPRRLNLNCAKSSPAQLVFIFRIFQCACDTANPKQNTL